MDIDAYLARIGYAGPREPTLENLRAMHAAHFRSVPFETVDIHLGRPIRIGEDAQFDKIVVQGRGGWCHEINGLWVRALRQLGYRADLLNGRVLINGRLTPPFSHETVLVHFDEPWLSDVDMSSRSAGPLRLHEAGWQIYDERRYVFDNDGDHWFLHEREPGMQDLLMIFTLQPHDFADFEPTCDWQQTSADSHFTWQPVATIPTPRGRAHLIGMTLMTIEEGIRSERILDSDAERDQVLAETFGIRLNNHTWLPPRTPPA